MSEKKIVMSEKMLEAEVANMTIKVAELMRTEWRDFNDDFVKRSCREFAKHYVAHIVETNLNSKPDDPEDIQ